MANNPVMSRNPYFNAQAATPNAYPTTGQGVPQAGSFQGQTGYDQFSQAQPEAQQQFQQYASPFQPQTTTTMTYDDAMVKTFILLAAAIVSGIATAILVPLDYILPVAVVASIGAFVLGMVASFQRVVKPGFAIGYAVLEGICLGGLTYVLNLMYPGVASQAVLGTVVVVAVAAGLHVSGKVRTTPKGRRVVLTVMIAAIIYGFINIILLMTGLASGWGLYSGSVGIVLGLVMIAVGGYMLIGDLELVKTAVAKGAPSEFAWTCAFGIVMTILWIYIEMLRLVSIIASQR